MNKYALVLLLSFWGPVLADEVGMEDSAQKSGDTSSSETASASATESTESAADSRRNLGWDYGFAGAFRHFPLAGSVSAEAGYNLHLWGEWQKADDVTYGYLRPSARAVIAGVVNAAEARLTLRPVSFVGLAVGRIQTSRRRQNSPGANCDIHECTGALATNFTQADLALAKGNVFLLGQTQWKRITSLRDELPFYEDLDALIGAKGEDDFLVHNHTIGYRTGARTQGERIIGLNYRRADTRLAQTFSERAGVVFGHRYGDYRVLYVLAQYRSDLVTTGPSFAVQVDWTGGPKGLAL